MKGSARMARFDTDGFELLALPFFEGEAELSGYASKVDAALGGLIGSLLSTKEFKAGFGQTRLIYSTAVGLRTKRVLLVGLGPRKEFNLEAVRVAAGRTAQSGRDLGVRSLTILSTNLLHGQSIEDAGQAAGESASLALYKFDRYKTEEKNEKKPPAEVALLFESEAEIPAAAKGLRIGGTIAEAVALSRDLANLPGVDCTPEILASRAVQIAQRFKMNCRILERSDMEAMNMGGLLGVSRGSAQPPKLIVLEYRGAGEETKPIALVGKAVTFDSGGISIKPADRMEEMKFDKSGGATVIATLQAAAALGLPINLVGLIPSTENLPSGSAYKPGDILKLYNGKTAEIVNTDAEGRLILYDTLAYASGQKPQAIVDLATLTGACVVALGSVTTGMMGNNRELIRRIYDAGEHTGEMVWELPLRKEYADAIKSEYADIKNSGGRPAGAITAAAFLSNAVGESPWAHLDIAGTAWSQEGSTERPYLPKGATGVGVRLLIHLLRNWKPLNAP